MTHFPADHSLPVPPLTTKNGPAPGVGTRRGRLWSCLIGGALALALSGCASPVPLATTWSMSTQQKIQSAQHWDVVAGHVEHEVASWLRLSNWENHPLAIEGVTDTAFSRGFKNLLTTHFLNDGFSLSTETHSAIRVQNDVQVITHKGRSFTLKPGTFTLLGSGIAVAEAAKSGMSIGATVGTSIAGGLLADWAAGYVTSESNSEIIITVSILNGTEIAFQKNFIFYVNDEDTDQYSAGDGERMITILGSISDPKAKTAAWKAADQRCAQRGRNKAMLRATVPVDDAQQEFRFDCVGQ